MAGHLVTPVTIRGTVNAEGRTPKCTDLLVVDAGFAHWTNPAMTLHLHPPARKVQAREHEGRPGSPKVLHSLQTGTETMFWPRDHGDQRHGACERGG